MRCLFPLFSLISLLLAFSTPFALGIVLADDLTSSSLTADSLHPLIWRVLFHDSGEGEFFTIYNPSEDRVTIAYWSVTDGEGTALFPPGTELAPRQELIVARNAQSFLIQNGRLPDYSLLPVHPDVPVLETIGTLRLNNDGDELQLRDPIGEMVDLVAFGEKASVVGLEEHWSGPPVPSPGKDRVICRTPLSDMLLDTDSRLEWLMLRECRPGQSELDIGIFQGEVTPLLLSDHSDIVLDTISSARESIWICAHEVDSLQVFSSLSGALSRGVEVRLAVEGSPPGGIKDQSKGVLKGLADSGAEVVLTKRDPDSVHPRRYSNLHSKYLIVDHELTVVLSENLVASVFDVDLRAGNRGWGVIAQSAELNSALRAIFLLDTDPRFQDVFRAEEVMTESGLEIDIETILTRKPTREVPEPLSPVECLLELHVFPDVTRRSIPLAERVSDAERSLFAEIFYADVSWSSWGYGEIPSPLMSAARDAAERCEEFLFCLDGSWLSQRSGRNSVATDFLLSAHISAHQSHYVGYPNESAPFGLLHNKGIVIDGRYSWISSANWNAASFTSNREIGLLVESEEIAEYYENKVRIDIWGDRAPPEIVPIIVKAEDDLWQLRLSRNSDESGLSLVIFETSEGYLSHWSLEVSPGTRDLRVKMLAEDLWGNANQSEMLLFPRDDSELRKSGLTLSLGTGRAISVAALSGIICLALSSAIGRRKS